MIVKRVCIRKSGETLPALKDAMAVEVSPVPLSVLFLTMKYQILTAAQRWNCISLCDRHTDPVRQ
jgi:hypothetical protein